MLNKRKNTKLGVNFVGHISGEYGLGEGARGTLRGLESEGIPFILNDIKVEWHRNLDDTYTDFTQEHPYPINLIHLNPGDDKLIENLGADFFQNRYNIGYWAWELPVLPPTWQSAFGLFDEIWTPSNYTGEAISTTSPIPVIKIPHSLNLPPLSLTREDLRLPKDKFIFLFMFDYHSTIMRKNPMGVIEAFKHAFGKENEQVLLIIKSSNSHLFTEKREFLKSLCEGWSSVRFIDVHLKKEELYALIGHSDCYVSLHRAEGFGLTMAEAMYYGKPVIATGYSANMEFMNVGNTFPVKYQLVTTTEAEGSYPKGSIWAEPDITHATSLMRYVFEHYSEAKEVGIKASEEIRSLLSPIQIGKKIRVRLEYIMKLKIRKEIEGEKIESSSFSADKFYQQTEHWNDEMFINKLYQHYLKREPDIEGKRYYFTGLQECQITRQEAIQNLCKSEERQSLCVLIKTELLPSLSGLEIISLHVPKTSTVAFNEVLKQVYGNQCVFSDTGNVSLEDIIKNGWITSRIKVIQGQFPISKYPECFEYYHPTLIVWLRHPLSRLISWYCNWINQPSQDSQDEFRQYIYQSQPDLVEFAEMEKTQNVMSQYLFGIKLTDIDFLGLQEFFKSDVIKLREKLGWPQLSVNSYNKNSYPSYFAYINDVLSNQKLVAKLAALNKTDMQLYQEALDLRAKRKSV